jgi:hypothetical protein
MSVSGAVSVNNDSHATLRTPQTGAPSRASSLNNPHAMKRKNNTPGARMYVHISRNVCAKIVFCLSRGLSMSKTTVTRRCAHHRQAHHHARAARTTRMPQKGKINTPGARMCTYFDVCARKLYSVCLGGCLCQKRQSRDAAHTTDRLTTTRDQLEQPACDGKGK